MLRFGTSISRKSFSNFSAQLTVNAVTAANLKVRNLNQDYPKNNFNNLFVEESCPEAFF